MICLLGFVAVTPPTWAAPRANRVPNPIVTGPVADGTSSPVNAVPFDLARYGYVQQEFFFRGIVDHARPVPFVVGPSSPAPARYVSRMLVWRPKGARRFTGTVIVEWNNVSLQSDTTIEWAWSHPEILRQGYAYVAVSAQQAGVCGLGLTGDRAGTCNPRSLKGSNPRRYALLSHPGDVYSYDIFSQAIQAIRSPRGVRPLGPLTARRILAVGQSQSAAALNAYVATGADDDARVVDAILSDSNGGLLQPPPYRVPFLALWSEESAQPVPYTAAPNFRLWMVAGTAHGDRWEFAYTENPGTEFDGSSSPTVGDYGQTGGRPTVCAPQGDQFPRRYAVDAAILALDRWVRTGQPAPVAPSLDFIADPTSELKPAANASVALSGALLIKRDRWGNAMGGLRLPPIDVPIATYNGTTCGLLGTTMPFSPTRKVQLYRTRSAYLAALHEATERALARGILTIGDAADLMRRAKLTSMDASVVSVPGPRPRLRLSER